MSTHACPGCRTVEIAGNQLACKACWFRVPRPIRDRITRAWAAKRRYPHDGDLIAAHRKAVGDALTWYREHSDGTR
jgi:hypothetical protein